MDGSRALGIREWYKDISDRHSGGVSIRLSSGILSLLRKKIWNETCFLCCRIKRLSGQLRHVLFTAVEDGALHSSCHSLLWYVPGAWSFLVYYLFEGRKKQALYSLGGGQGEGVSIFVKLQRPFPHPELSHPKLEEPPTTSSEVVSLFYKSPSWGGVNIITPILHIFHSRSI